ncbi:DUF429 domain-containing protein [Rubripirellula amarantea]|nr:DUF429 domain-containing protein [Rubripirellula amarantea]
MSLRESVASRSERQALCLIQQIQANHLAGDRYAIGIDVAASMSNWGLSVIRLAEDPKRNTIAAIFPHSLKTADGLDHKTIFCRPSSGIVKSLLEWINTEKISTIIAVDVPFGWPTHHRDFLNNFSAAAGLNEGQELPSRRDFERRFCDVALTQRFKDQRVAPLSVSADTLGQAAFSWAVERQKLANLIGAVDLGLPTNETHLVRCIETYPAAFVRCCFPDQANYKSATQQEQRRELVSQLFRAYDLSSNEEVNTWCERACCQAGSPDALDSLLCAFCGWDHLQFRSGRHDIAMSTPNKLLNRPMTKTEESRIESEGWILFRYEAFSTDGTNNSVS